MENEVESLKKQLNAVLTILKEVRKQRDVLYEANIKYQQDMYEARRVALEYRDKYADIYGYPCPEFKLPWEDGYGVMFDLQKK